MESNGKEENGGSNFISLKFFLPPYFLNSISNKLQMYIPLYVQAVFVNAMARTSPTVMETSYSQKDVDAFW